MSLRFASLARPLAALAPCTNCTFPSSPYPPLLYPVPPAHSLPLLIPPSYTLCPLYIPFLSLSTFPYRAVRAAGRPGRVGAPETSGPRSGEPSGSRTGFTRESRRGAKNTNFYPMSGRSGAHLGLQSSKPWPRMASSRFSVHFWHHKCPF